jgi:hypothetical protein
MEYWSDGVMEKNKIHGNETTPQYSNTPLLQDSRRLGFKQELLKPEPCFA